MRCSERSRREKASYSSQSRSVTSLTAERDRSRRPLSSVKASSMSRVEEPAAWSSTASSSSASVRPASALRIAEENGFGVSPHLRRGIVDHALGGLELPGPIPVPGIPQPRPRRARSAPARPPRSPRRPAPLPRSAAPPAGPGPTAMPPSRGARRSKPATPRASAQMPIFSPWGCSLGRRRQPFRPLSCFNSGRVHPIPLFQQLYAFTSTTLVDTRTARSSLDPWGIISTAL